MSSYLISDDDPHPPNSLMLQWREKFTVGKFTQIAEDGTRAMRYVRLVDIGRLLASPEESLESQKWEWQSYPWAGVYHGTYRKHQTLVYVQSPVVASYGFHSSSAGTTTETEIRTPHLIWTGQWTPTGELQRSYLLCATTKPTLGLRSICTPWPFGNVHPDGHICWGQVQAHLKLKPEDFNQISQLFFQSGFNRDLWYASDELAEILGGDSDEDERRIDLTEHMPDITNYRPIQNWLRLPGETT